MKNTVLLLIVLLLSLSTARALIELQDIETEYVASDMLEFTVNVESSSQIPTTVSFSSNKGWLTLDEITLDVSDFTPGGTLGYVAQAQRSIRLEGVGSVTLEATMSQTNYSSSDMVAFTVFDNVAPSFESSAQLQNGSLRLTVVTDREAVCKFGYNQVPYEDLTYIIYSQTAPNTYSYLISPVFEKTYTMYIACKDVLSQTVSQTTEFEYILDVTPPTILGHMPQTNGDASVTLSIDASEEVMCKYDYSNKTYSSLKFQFGSSFETRHSAALSAPGMTIVIQCKDRAGNFLSSPYTVSYESLVKPSASISIKNVSSNGHLKAGLYDVSVTSNKQLMQDPTLQLVYVLDGGTKSIVIPLQQESSLIWEGKLYVPASEFEGVAYFSYDALDLEGVRGTKITHGGSVQIGTRLLNAPLGLSAKFSDGEVSLAWDPLNDPFLEHYIIYRQLMGDDRAQTTFVTPQTTFADDEIIQGKNYSYKVAAVSLSGTIGLFSERAIIDTTSKSGGPLNTNQPNSSFSIPPFLQENLNIATSQLDSAISELAAREIEEGEFSALQLSTKNEKVISDARLFLTNSKLKSFESSKDVSQHISAILEEAKRIKQSYIVDIKVIERQTMDMKIADEEFSALVSSALAARRFIGDESSVIKQSKQLTRNEKLEVSATKVQVTYANDAYESYTVYAIERTQTQGELAIPITEKFAPLFYENKALSSGTHVFSAKSVMFYVTGMHDTQTSRSLRAFILAPTESTSSAFTGNFIMGVFGNNSVAYYALGTLVLLLLGIMYYKGLNAGNLWSYITSKFSSKTSRPKQPTHNQSVQPVSKSSAFSFSAQTRDQTALQTSAPTRISFLAETVQRMQELEARASTPMANPQFDMGLGLASSDEQLPLAAHLSYQALHMPAPMHAHFVTQDGKVLRSIVDVIFELEHMPPHIFSHHVNEQKHDFAQWIKDVYGFSEFAFCMQPIKDKNTLLTFLHTVLKTSRKYETTKR